MPQLETPMMIRLRFLLVVLLLALVTGGCQAAKTRSGRHSEAISAASPPTARQASPLAGAGQVVVVVADDWNTNQARLRRFERAKSGHFVPVGDDVAVTLGTYGLAWGRGLHGAALGPGPVKMEGDRRSPAGVFALPLAFAYQPGDLWKTPKIPVHPVTTETVCVETIDSKAYNRILDEGPATVKDWESPDHMLRPDGLYRYGLFVAHNSPDVKPGSGSCIFMPGRVLTSKILKPCGVAIKSARLYPERPRALWAARVRVPSCSVRAASTGAGQSSSAAPGSYLLV